MTLRMGKVLDESAQMPKHESKKQEVATKRSSEDKGDEVGNLVMMV
mgnify:CR=1 FL=1